MVSKSINDSIAALEAAQQLTAPDRARMRALIHGESVPGATEDERRRAARIRELLDNAEKRYQATCGS